MDRKTAEFVVAAVNRCIDDLIATLEVLEKTVPPDEFEKYKRGVGRIMRHIGRRDSRAATQDHPDLKPTDDDEPEADPKILKS